MMEGVIERRNKNEFYVVYIYPEADPFKRNNPKWFKEATQGMAKEEIEREFRINFDAGLGKRIFDEFEIGTHTGNFEYIQGLPIYRGWDFGYERPACVWAQKDKNDVWHVLRELYIPRTYLGDFADEVLRISTEFSNENGKQAEFFDFVDATGKRTEVTSGTDSISLLAGKGIHASFRWSDPYRQYQLVHKLLRVRGDGQPSLKVDKDKCPLLIKGFMGAFCAKERLTKGQIRAIDGSEKNPSIDVMEAFLYIIDNMEYMAEYEEVEPTTEEDWNEDKITGVPL